MNTTAAVLYEVKKPLVVEDVELLEPGPHEVQVRWRANGVCHSDFHIVNGRRRAWSSGSAPGSTP
jgi:Zn-dependent alcohol dehydrogenase